MGKEKQSFVRVGEEESVSPVLWLISSLLHVAFSLFPMHLRHTRFEATLLLLSGEQHVDQEGSVSDDAYWGSASAGPPPD